MRLVVSAFACRPKVGSEPGIGWAWASNLAQHHDVLVLTDSSNQPTIARYQEEHSERTRLSFAFYGGPWTPYFDRVKANVIQCYYPYWQSQIAKWAERDIVRFKPDLIHHVTYVRYWTASSLAGNGLPFVFGPVGGGESSPNILRSTLSREGRWLERTRDLSQRLSERNSAVLSTIRNASITLATTEPLALRLAKLGAPKVRQFPGCGVDSGDLAQLDRYRKPRRCRRYRFITVSRFTHWKAVHLSIRALALCDDFNAHLDILGDGREKARLQKLVGQLRLGDRVRFYGVVDRPTLLSLLPLATALLHPSLREVGAGVCLEAMAARVPVICLDRPSSYVTSETGFMIPPSDPDTVVEQIAECMKRLAADQGLVARLGEAGRQRVKEEFLWEKRIERIMESMYPEI